MDGQGRVAGYAVRKNRGSRLRFGRPVSIRTNGTLRGMPFSFGVLAASRADAFRTARDAGVLTHGHPSGYLSAAYLAALVYDLLRGASLEQCFEAADALLAAEREHEELALALRRARSLASAGPPTAAALEELGGGWVGEEALAIGIVIALTATASCLSEALYRAVAHGGDSTGSIAGTLLGAEYGVEALPPRWVGQVELASLITRVGSELHRAATEGGCPNPTDFPPVDGVLLFGAGLS